MNLELLSFLPMILFAILFIVLMWGVVKLWKTQKFVAFICLALAAAVAVGFFGLYWNKFFG